MREWLEVWAATRRARKVLLAAWCGGKHQTGRAKQGVAWLRSLADQYKLDFLCANEAQELQSAPTQRTSLST